MRYTIEELDDGRWALNAGDERTEFATYDKALTHLAGMAPMNVDMRSTGDGLLPERWESPVGIAFAAQTGPTRDFTNVTWSWRDPQATVVPLMLQTKNLPAHQEAELAGFTEEITMPTPGVPRGSGRFYDTEAGRSARDLLLDGRKFPVSVDPSENVEAEWICTEFDEEGFCLAEKTSFTRYEIAGLTMVPMAGFGDPDSAATIALAGQEPTPMYASAQTTLSIPTTPPREWMTLAEPAPGVPFLDGIGDDVLIEQTDREGNVQGMACPLTIRDDGLVYGHLTYWGQCHTGNPWGPNVCASAQPSATGYREFHASGEVICDDGTRVPTGQLVVGCEHSSAFDVAGVRDHLAHAGMGWASVHVVDGQFGPWLCGVLRPDLTEAQVRTLRALSLSGEWVGELGGILAVNASGLPVQRERLAASAHAEFGWTIPGVTLRSSARNGEVTKLVGANLVRRCPECAKRAAEARTRAGSDLDPHRIMEMLTTLERRTRHLVPVEAAVRASGLAAINGVTP